MSAEKHTHEGTKLGVDAWLETKEKDVDADSFGSAARILAGEEPLDPEGELEDWHTQHKHTEHK